MSSNEITKDIMNRLRTVYMGRSLYYFDETDSTNLRIRQLAGEGAPEGTLAVADMQTAGRGRRGRGWVSPPGMNIYMSFLLKPDIAASDASMITLIAAMAVAGAVRELPGAIREANDEGSLTNASNGGCVASADIGIKWPNDIVVNRRKVCGILTEMDMDGDRIRNVIVGIGINVNQASRDLFPGEIRETASSLLLELGCNTGRDSHVTAGDVKHDASGSGEMIDRNDLIARIMFYFEKEYDEFLRSGDLSFLCDSYNGMLAGMNSPVRVLDPQGEYTGISRGIDERGQLLVEREDGSVTAVYAGEVSVRGLYGYV